MYRSHQTKLVALFIISACFSIPTSADDDITTGTGNELIKYCNQKNYTDSGFEWTYCIGYVNGINNGYQVAMEMLAGVKGTTDKIGKPDQKLVADNIYGLLTTVYCIPSNVTRQQTALVVTKFLADDPQELNDSAGDLVVSAFIKAWPCPKSGT